MSKRWLFYSYQTGQGIQVAQCPETEALDLAQMLQCAFLEVGQEVTDSTHYVVDGGLQAFSIKPSKFHQWDWQIKAWSLPQEGFDLAVASKKGQVDLERARQAELPLSYRGVLFDADTRAQSNVQGWMVNISNGLEVPPGFTWRDYNNVDHPADAEFIKGLGAAMVHRGSQLYQRAWELKASIDALSTLEEIESFAISSDSF